MVGAVLRAGGAGVLSAAIPFAAGSRLRLTRRALPLVVASGLAEVVGFASFAFGARHGIAVSAVLASQFAAVPAGGGLLFFCRGLRPPPPVRGGLYPAGGCGAPPRSGSAPRAKKAPRFPFLPL